MCVCMCVYAYEQHMHKFCLHKFVISLCTGICLYMCVFLHACVGLLFPILPQNLHDLHTAGQLYLGEN